MTKSVARFLLILGIVLFILSLTSLDFLSAHVSDAITSLTALRSSQPWLLACVFVALFALISTIGLPGGAIMSLTAGYLFGVVAGFCLVLLSILVALICTWQLIRAAHLNTGQVSFALYQRLRAIIAANPYPVLLFIRFVPVAPFYLVNLLAAASGVSFKAYTVTGVAGLIPSSLALTLIGQGIGLSLLEDDVSVAAVLMQPMVLYPSLMLALMSLMALIYRQALRH